MRQGDFNSHCLEGVFPILQIAILNEFHHSNYLYLEVIFLKLLLGYCSLFLMLYIH